MNSVHAGWSSAGGRAASYVVTEAAIRPIATTKQKIAFFISSHQIPERRATSSSRVRRCQDSKGDRSPLVPADRRGSERSVVARTSKGDRSGREAIAAVLDVH